MNKNLKIKFFYFFLGAILFSSGTIFAYSLISSNVGFTPKDSSWNVDNVKTALDDLYDNASCNKHFIGAEWSYNYTGTEKEFKVPCTGAYKLETWGAQGGTANGYRGGYGAYSVGIINLGKYDKLYVNVGQIGYNNSTNSSHIAYNGGGYGHQCDGSRYAGGGGGATHIAKKSGLLSTLENYKDDILIVAGAGGGGSNHLNPTSQVVGGSGGGLAGISGSSARYAGGSGGTQTSGGTGGYFSGASAENGSFGKGGHGRCNAGGGGGSGYYGGGGGYGGSGGGGSSYIASSKLISSNDLQKHMTCYNCTTSNDENTKTLTTTNVSEAPTSDYTKIGNGYAKITLISTD